MTSTMRFDKWENSLGQPYGTVLQVTQGVLSDIVTFTTSGAWTPIGLSATITPRFLTSKILITVHIGIGSNGTNSWDAAMMLFRNNTEMQLPNFSSLSGRRNSFVPFGDRAQSNFEMTTVSNSYLDSPETTSALSYDIRAFNHNNTNTHFINRTGADVTGGGDNRMISTITLMEIAQ